MRGTFYVTLDIGKRLIAEKKRASFLSILTTWVWSGSAFVVPSAMSKTAINAMTQRSGDRMGPFMACASMPSRRASFRPRG